MFLFSFFFSKWHILFTFSILCLYKHFKAEISAHFHLKYSPVMNIYISNLPGREGRWDFLSLPGIGRITKIRLPKKNVKLIKFPTNQTKTNRNSNKNRTKEKKISYQVGSEHAVSGRWGGGDRRAASGERWEGDRDRKREEGQLGFSILRSKG